MKLKLVCLFGFAFAALFVGAFLAYLFAVTPVVPSEVVQITDFRIINGNGSYLTGLGFLAFGAGVLSVTAAAFGFHASDR